MLSVIFDIDDTLYDRRDPFRYAYAKVFGARWDLDLEQVYKTFYERGNEVFEASMNDTMSMRDMRICRIQRAMADYGALITEEEADGFQDAYLWGQHHIQLIPGMENVLEFCRQSGLFLGIITNGKHDHQFMKFHALQLDRWIPETAFLATEDIGVNKPNPLVFQRAEAFFHFDAKDVWYVGDSYEHDMEPAHFEGWHTIWINKDHTLRHHAESAADYSVSSPEELLACLKKIVL